MGIDLGNYLYVPHPNPWDYDPIVGNARNPKPTFRRFLRKTGGRTPAPGGGRATGTGGNDQRKEGARCLERAVRDGGY